MSRRQRILRAGGIFACSVFALLLWSKLKLVSGIPRTAFANPESASSAPRIAKKPAQDAAPAAARERHAAAPDGELPR